MSVEGKVVLVTGAGGSIGTRLVNELLNNPKPKSLILVDLCEYNLYQVQRVVEESGVALKCKYLLADIRHRHLMDCVFRAEAPDVVFHAAALKHVPMLETPHNTLEAIRTNILGTKNVLDMSVRYGAEQFLLISTDKAVNPVSMMGATKTFAEGYVREAATSVSLNVSIVRFGNVLGSSGSVVPLFARQVAEGGPVTVTHPDIIRYFMSIDDAVRLVVESAHLTIASHKTSCTYVLNMGDPVKIDDLAKKMIWESGKDIAIKYIGLRAGEKMEEELHYANEFLVPTSRKNINIVRQSDHLRRGFVRVANELVTLCDERELPDAFVAIKEKVPYQGDTILCESL